MCFVVWKYVWKYVWVKTCVILFKNWKHVFELPYQIGPKYFNTHTAEEIEESLKETDTTSLHYFKGSINK